MSNCAIDGDHKASGSRVVGITLPMGFINGYQTWMILSFCEDHSPKQLNEYPPGTHFHGKLQIGMKE